MKRLICFVILFIASITANAAPAISADQLVRNTAETMLARIDANRDRIQAEPEYIYEMVNEVMLPHVDFTRMARWVLGKHWRRANPEQRQQFVNEFRTLIVRTYSTALLEYSGQKIDFLPARGKAGSKQVSVKTEIHPAQGPTIPITYSLYENDDAQWKVYDVSIDGISLVNNYRTSFSSQIRRAGGLNKLINQLQSRNQQAKK